MLWAKRNKHLSGHRLKARHFVPFNMKKAIELVDRISSGQNVLLLAGLYVLMVLFIMPAAVADFERFAGGNLPLELQFWYTPAMAAQSLEAYGEEGRKFYLFILTTADMVSPIIASAFYCSILGWLIKKKGGAWPWYLPLVPWLLAVFNFFENAFISLLLVGYPGEYYWLAVFAMLVTFLKRLAVLATVLLLLGSVFAWLKSWRMEKRAQKKEAQIGRSHVQ